MASPASTVTKVVTKLVSSTTPTSTLRAAPQGGVLEGGNPSHYDPKNPIILFIIQAGIIIIFCRLLHYPLSLLRQPRVIAEVIGGIILGPSVMMRIPGFQNAIFPAAAMPNLTLVANVGLILFLFLVGLEVNMRMFTSNWRVALSVGLAGMALPFGLGCAIAWGLYEQFKGDPGTKPISFGVYMLFIGTALSITAFPVLCRILTELKLLGTPVGVTVLAAGVGNDVTGWILLALCVALVNNGSGITALYVLLCAVGWILFLVFAIRPGLIWLLRRSGSLKNGPTQGMVAITLLLTLTSAWFTGIIGVHPIFGAFLVGLICPHEGGFAIRLAEKIEDLVSVLFLPLYFALSGLSTNLGLLNDGITWAYVIGVIAVAFSGKIIGGTLAARACKLVWRESLTIGVLMSCKGLVELIVLNIGLQAKILSTRTFTVFVVMALVTTVSTTPLTTLLYPPWYQKKLEAWKRGEITWDGKPTSEGDSTPEQFMNKLQNTQICRLLVYLRLDTLPSVFTFITLLGGDLSTPVRRTHHANSKLETVNEASEQEVFSPAETPLEVQGVRMLELTERTSSVMKVSEVDSTTYNDPVTAAFRTFAQLHCIAVSSTVSVVPASSYADVLNTQATDYVSDLVLIPWTKNSSGVSDDVSGQSGSQEAFIQQALRTATRTTAVFLSPGFGCPVETCEPRPLTRTTSGLSLRSRHHRDAPTRPTTDPGHHIYLPFFGGVDDRVALRFVLQLAQKSNVTATIVHFQLSGASDAQKPGAHIVGEDASKTTSEEGSSSRLAITEAVSHEDAHCSREEDAAFLHTLRDSLPSALASRVVFIEHAPHSQLDGALDYARHEIGRSPNNAGDLIVVGRGKRLEGTNEMRKTVGVVAETMINAGLSASVLVVQAGKDQLEMYSIN